MARRDHAAAILNSGSGWKFVECGGMTDKVREHEGTKKFGRLYVNASVSLRYNQRGVNSTLNTSQFSA